MQTARSFHVKSRWKSGWQNADEKCTRRKCGRTRVVRLLASWIRGIIPSTPCTPCAFLRSAHFFHHTSNKIRLVFQRKLSTTLLRHDRLTPFFFFFFNKSANFFQLFLSISYFIFFYLFTLIFPSKKKIHRFKRNLYTIICYDTKLIRRFLFFFFELRQRVIFLLVKNVNFGYFSFFFFIYFKFFTKE